MSSDSLNQPNSVIAMVDQLIRSRRITHQQYQNLSSVVLADGNVDETERRQINRLFDAIQSGLVKIVD